MNNLAGAIIFLPKDATGTLMLEDLLFEPAAVWLSQALQAVGLDRFLVVCHADDRDAAAPCFPEGTQYVTTGDEGAPEILSRFLGAQNGRVLVVTHPVFLTDAGAKRLADPGALPRGEGTGVYRLDAAVLKKAVEGDSSAEFEDILQDKGEELGEMNDWFYRSVIRLDSRLDLQDVQTVARRMVAARLARQGVRFVDPDAVYLGPKVQVGKGTVILPGTILRGTTVIGEDCELGPNTMIRDCTVGDRVCVNASQLNESVVEADTAVGPFAYLRPGCHVGPGVKVGDFVELKNSTIGAGTKISHLTYVGDSDVGERVNFGCGTVTVNYDGEAKFRTLIGDDVFLGCNTNLVAPVKVGDGAYTAAGSTITDDVPADSLAIARSQQVVKKQWAAKRKKKHG